MKYLTTSDYAWFIVTIKNDVIHFKDSDGVKTYMSSNWPGYSKGPISGYRFENSSQFRKAWRAIFDAEGNEVGHLHWEVKNYQ